MQGTRKGVAPRKLSVVYDKNDKALKGMVALVGLVVDGCAQTRFKLCQGSVCRR